jgi:ketosteroid isomerase-like protein
MMKVLAVTSLLLTACATSTTMSSNDADTYIRTHGPMFAQAFSRGDWPAVSSYYTDDAVMMAPNAEIARGPAAIGQAFGTFQAMKPSLTLTPDRIVQSDDMAYEYGTYRMQMTPPNGALMNDRGKYLTIWRKMPGGEWKIAADMFNTSMPAPGM